MTVRPLEAGDMPSVAMPDVPLGGRVAPAAAPGSDFAGALAKAFADAGAGLERAAQAERAFESGRGGLQEMVLERAQADVALAVASAAATRTSQSLSTILGMQV